MKNGKMKNGKRFLKYIPGSNQIKNYLVGRNGGKGLDRQNIKFVSHKEVIEYGWQ